MAKKEDQAAEITIEDQATDTTGALEAPAEIKKRVKCIIRNQQGQDGKNPVFVRVLGESAYEAHIPRETPVDLPDYVFEYLKGLEGYEVVPESLNGKVVMTEKPFKRYIIEKVD